MDSRPPPRLVGALKTDFGDIVPVSPFLLPWPQWASFTPLGTERLLGAVLNYHSALDIDYFWSAAENKK